jgi:AraC family transcriptional regulator of adaptative response / DNA-3-methyladenine glycosylase II
MHTHAAYERARLSRDSRFDGQFFVGVRTTGIYCRPVCPANPPRRENVEYFPSAAAAGEAGFRPCLRCRPECAPGTPAWHGASTTVRRGLRLIANGALDDGNVEQLAERLGVTSRHLRRLFRMHLGASPLAVAHTQRLHFAKRLIDQTRMPLRDIAVAAGYRSIRRFNDTFLSTYGRSPRELRRHFAEVVPRDAAFAIELPYRKPFAWRQLLEFAAARSIPGVESVTGNAYRRTIVVDGRHGVLAVDEVPERGCLRLQVDGVGTTELFAVAQKVREMFDLDAPVLEIRRSLATDPSLRSRLGRRPIVRVPGTWNGFELAVRAVLGQQVTVRAATTLSGRLVGRHGLSLDPELAQRFRCFGLTHVFPAPEVLARAELGSLGITGARIETIRGLSRALMDGKLSFDTAQDPGAFAMSLTGLRGIGDWTAQYVAMRALKSPDAFPASDLGLLRAFDGDGRRIKPAELLARAEGWRPWRAYAAMLLWNSIANSGG